MKNIEVIVSDNSSTDGTQEVVKKYSSDFRFKYYITQPEENNWIKLLYEFSSGDYGMLLCDDDYILRNTYISECVSLLLTHKVSSVLTAFIEFIW